MLRNSQSSVAPETVVVEHLPDGKNIVRLHDNVTVRTEDDGTVYDYDEVVFALPEDRTETVESIAADFAAWWTYGQQDEPEITLEQRVAELEEMLLAMMEA